MGGLDREGGEGGTGRGGGGASALHFFCSKASLVGGGLGDRNISWPIDYTVSIPFA